MNLLRRMGAPVTMTQPVWATLKPVLANHDLNIAHARSTSPTIHGNSPQINGKQYPGSSQEF